MISFLKLLISGIRSEEENEKDKNVDNDKKNIKIYKKIIYLLIIFCAVFFVALIIYFCVKNLPSFIDTIKEAISESKYVIENLKP